MEDEHEVISALLDNEPFDPVALDATLSSADGRALLIDLAALRHLMQAPVAVPAVGVAPRQRPWWRFVAAAAVILAAITGYAVGERQGGDSAAAVATAAPSATRVVEPAATWQAIPPGGRQ